MFDSIGSKTKVLPILATGSALAFLLSSLLTLSPSGTETEAATPKTSIAQNPELQTPPDFSLIGEFHLFGRPGSASSSVGGLPPESTQPLKLKGVVYLPDKHAHAIIEASDQSQKTYRINDILPGGAILQAIESNSIVIMTDDRQESLILTKTKLEQTQPAAEEQPVSPEPANEIIIQPPESLAN
ncbi:MAG: type II secretion system protein N [Methylococcaceae bacterium]